MSKYDETFIGNKIPFKSTFLRRSKKLSNPRHQISDGQPVARFLFNVQKKRVNNFGTIF